MEVFSLRDLSRELGLTPKERAIAKTVLSTLLKEGKIVRKGYGIYQVPEMGAEPLDFKKAQVKPIDLKLPLGIHDWVYFLPKNIIVIAGASDAGKTALMFNIIMLNQKRFEIHYFSSEMGEMELKSRLEKCREDGEPDWQFHAWAKSNNFADEIRPDAINLIDFLEIHQDFYLVGAKIKQIYDKLDKGLAIIAIQKKRGAPVGRGGEITLEKPRLYLLVDKGRITIAKAKNWKNPRANPNGRFREFKLYDGCKFEAIGPWCSPDEERGYDIF